MPVGQRPRVVSRASVGEDPRVGEPIDRLLANLTLAELGSEARALGTALVAPEVL